MRYCALFLLLAVVLLGVPSAAVSLHDTIETVDGQTLTGTVDRKDFMVETEAGERFEIPRESIRQMTFDGDQVQFQLIEGQGMQGRLLDDQIHVRLDLFDRVLDADEVRRITFAPPGTLVPEGTEVELRLLGPLDPFDSPATEVLLCVSREVRIGDETVIPANTPVLGRVVVEDRRAPDQAAAAGIALTDVLPETGATLPLRPHARVRGGAALTSGSEPVAVFPAPGLTLVAETSEDTLRTTADADTGTATVTPSMRRCADSAIAGAPGAHIPIEWLATEVPYRGAPEPLELQVRLDPLFDQNWQLVRLSNVVVDDTRILHLRLSLRETRRGAKLVIRNALKVDPSRDRSVDLRYELLAGDQRIADHTEREVEVEEGKTNTVGSKIALSAAELDSLKTEGPALLRISMTVEDD